MGMGIMTIAIGGKTKTILKGAGDVDVRWGDLPALQDFKKCI